MLYIPTITVLNKLVIDPYRSYTKDKDIVTKEDIDRIMSNYKRDMLPTFMTDSGIENKIKDALFEQIKDVQKVFEIDYDNHSISFLRINDDIADGEANRKNVRFLFKCIKWCFLSNCNHECYVTSEPGVVDVPITDESIIQVYPAIMTRLKFSYHNRITGDSLFIEWIPTEPKRLYVSIISKGSICDNKTKLYIDPTIHGIYGLLYNISHIYYDEHRRMSADIYLKGSPIELLYKHYYATTGMTISKNR